tara:strand:+ start:83 stop:847 length:765 start_codon:yes stop_codon:yes gene_type:complete
MDSDEEYYDINNFDIINKYNPKLCLEENNKKVYVINYKFLKECKKWGPNRKYNKLHLSKIADQLELEYNNTKTLNLHGIISIGYNETNFVLIDGQHRKIALNILENKIDFNLNIIIEVYTGNDNLFKNIFKKINNSRPVNVDKLYIDKFIKLKNFLNEEYNFNNYPILRTNTRRPYIDETKLWENIVDSSIFMNIDLNIIFENIKIINEKIKGKILSNKNISESLMKRMNNFNCYLGYDKKFIWLKSLENKIKL